MSNKSSKSSKKASAKKKRFALELTRKELFIWLGIAFLAMVWMFTLGVIVGRGFSPVRFDVEKLKKELMALKQQAMKREQTLYEKNADKLSRKDSLDFYELLTDKKEQARLKPSSKAQQQSGKAKQEARTSRGRLSKAKPEVRAKGPTFEGLFTLQVASLKDLARAREVISDLKDKGYAAYEVTAHVPGKGTYHRVRVGHFKDRNEAKQAAARLRGEKLEPIIISE
jgi:cell division protein FtsN